MNTLFAAALGAGCLYFYQIHDMLMVKISVSILLILGLVELVCDLFLKFILNERDKR